MKIKRLILLLTLYLTFSCDQEQKDISLLETNNSDQVILDTIGNAVTDKNLKLQLKEYLAAVNGGDPDKALYYIYPDIFEYLKQQYPDEKLDMQEVKEEMLLEPIRKLKKATKEKKIKYEFQVGDITKKVKYKNSLLRIVITYVNTISKLDKHSLGGEIIAISNDKGANWKFAQKDSAVSRGILQMKFPSDIVDKILSR